MHSPTLDTEPTPTRLLPTFIAGLLVLAGGFLAVRQWLPEWEPVALPSKAEVLQQLDQAIRDDRLDLKRESLRVYLSSRGTETYLISRELGAAAPAFIRAQHLPFYVEALGTASWNQGPVATANIAMGLDGRVWGVEWMPVDFTAFLPTGVAETSRTNVMHGVEKLLVRPQESLGDATRMVAAGNPVTVRSILGSDPPEHLHLLGQGAIVNATRRVGTPESAKRNAQVLAPLSLLLGKLPGILLAVLTLGLFLRLSSRQRIDFKNALGLAGLLALVSVVHSVQYWTEGWIFAVQGLLAPIIASISFLVLWSVAESWHRTARPGWVNSLDGLRRGRLGPALGQALLGGFALGLVLAGGRLALPALASRFTTLPLAAPIVDLPAGLFAAKALTSGLFFAGSALLMIALSQRALSSRWAPWAAVVLIAVVSPSSHYSFWVAVLFNLGLAAVVVWAHQRWNVTGLLTASVVGWVLPTTLFAGLHFDWMSGVLATSTLLLIAPLATGALALRKSPLDEDQRAMAPAFVRRIEEERRLRYEMGLLARMQRGLLPAALPELPGYQIAARSLLATEAGGDLYHFFHGAPGTVAPTERFWVAAGDVAGHGYSCAIAQAMTKAALVTLLKDHTSPAAVLHELDRVLRSGGIERHFTSLALLCLDPATGEGRISNAGHPFPFHVAATGVHEIEQPSLPLGQGPARHYQDRAIYLAPGDTLVFYSDGLFESASPAGVPYGFDRPRAVLHEEAHSGAGTILGALLADWRDHLAATPAADDTTLVIVQRLPAGI